MNKKLLIGGFAIVMIAVVIGIYYFNFFESGDKKSEVLNVGILSGLDFFASTADGFKIKMTEMGYTEGKDIIYDLQKTNFDPEKEVSIIKEFVANKVDLIVVIGTEASLTAKSETKGTDIPVIFANANVEGVSLVDSIREPGGNITGVRYPGPDVAVKRFEIALKLLPGVKRMLVPHQKGYPIVASQIEKLKPIAESKGIKLIEIPAENAVDLETLLEKQSKTINKDTDFLLMIPEPLAVSLNSFLVLSNFALKHNLLFGGALVPSETYEPLFGVGTENIAVGKQVAMLADKIFKNIPAGTIPVVSAENNIQLNYRAAQKIGLKIPEDLLSQANEIIR